MKHYNIYMTDWGEVRISDDELALLRLEQQITSYRLDDDPRWQTLLLKAGYLRSDCERFAFAKVVGG